MYWRKKERLDPKKKVENGWTTGQNVILMSNLFTTNVPPY